MPHVDPSAPHANVETVPLTQELGAFSVQLGKAHAAAAAQRARRPHAVRGRWLSRLIRRPLQSAAQQTRA